jgi:AraC-like DNA-binding protein
LREHLTFFDYREKSNEIIKIHSCGTCRGSEPLLPQGRKNDEGYVLHYFTKGQGKFKVEGGSWIDFKNDYIILFYPGMTYYLSAAATEHLEHYYCTFSGKLVDALLEKVRIAQRSIVQIKKNKLFRQRFIDLMDDARLVSINTYRRANGTTHALINDTLELLHGQADMHDETLLDIFLAYVNQNIQASELDLTELLHNIKMSKAKFTSVIKTHTGSTPYQLWLLYRVNRGKQLLSNSENSIKEIASCLGFSDEFYFSRIFKKKEGCSPKHYRERLYH